MNESNEERYKYLEEQGIEDGSDGAGAPVHHPEHLPRLPRIVPPHLSHCFCGISLAHCIIYLCHLN